MAAFNFLLLASFGMPALSDMWSPEPILSVVAESLIQSYDVAPSPLPQPRTTRSYGDDPIYAYAAVSDALEQTVEHIVFYAVQCDTALRTGTYVVSDFFANLFLFVLVMTMCLACQVRRTEPRTVVVDATPVADPVATKPV